MMRKLLFALCLSISLPSCSEQIEPLSTQEASYDSLVNEFQSLQKEWVGILAKIHDEKSFDQQIRHWRNVNQRFSALAKKLEKVSPAPPATSKEMKLKIAAGNSKTEPTGEMMFSLLGIESRANLAIASLEEFEQSLISVMIQFHRVFPEDKESATPQE